jgi:putative zinc finger protein
VTHADQGQHLDDETLSASIDDRLAPNDAAAVQAHLETCQACRERLEDLRSVVGLLRQLPLLEPPRVVWGPRLVADPPNVVRLRRVYTLARAGAAALAAVFVLSSAGALYEGATAPSTSSDAASALIARATQPATAPAAPPAAARVAPQAANPAQPVPAPQAARPSGAAAQTGTTAPAAGAPGAAAANAGGAARSAADSAEVAPNQTGAATGAGGLPTQVPTVLRPQPLATRPPAAAQPFSPAPAVAGGPLRTAAVITGVLAVLAVFTAIFIRRRLARLTNLVSE